MNIINLEEVNSTNLYAKENLDILDDKTIVIATRQTAGRGRFDRKWVDLGEGNLFMTIVLKPSDVFREVYANYTQYLSVSLTRVLEEYGLSPKIKWPNDVIVNNAKIAGILAETVMQGNCFKGLVLGIGVNLNADKNDLVQIRDKLLGEFFKNYEEFLRKGFSMIKEYYEHRCNFLGKEVDVQVFNQKKSGLVKGINDLGELILEDRNGEFILTMGDIL